MSRANLRRHKLRATLTTLGIVLGIGAVIGTLSMGTSFEAGFIDAFDGIFDPDAMLVQPGELRASAAQSGFFTVPMTVFTERDVAEVARLDGVERAYGLTFLQLDTADGMRFGNRSFPNPNAYASTAGFIGPLGYRPVAHGRGIEARGEAVVSYEIAQDLALYAGKPSVEDVPGLAIDLKTTRGDTLSPRVVGVMKQSPASGPSAFVYVHVEPWMLKERPLPGEAAAGNVTAFDAVVAIGGDGAGSASIKPVVVDYLETQSDAARFLARDAPRLGFVVITQADLTSFIQEQIGQFGGFISSIGLISLLVGSVGIANTMLVSVTERTREIGIMKATGARRRDILQLFLVEAVALCLVGAVLGTLVGAALGFGLTQYGFFARDELPFVFSFAWIPLAVGVGVLAGLLSGIYPAWRAARQNPVEALRYE